MGSWSGTLPSKQAERPHFRTTVDIALPIMQAGQRGWSGDRESWSGSPHPGQAEPPPSGQPLALPLTAIQNGQRGWPGTWMVMIGLTRHPNQQSPTLRETADTAPSPPPRMSRKVQPTGPAGWYKIRLLPILQPTGPVRRVRAAASAEAV